MLAEKLFRVCLEVLHSHSNLDKMPETIMIRKEDCSLADANCISLSYREPSGYLGLTLCQLCAVMLLDCLA